MPPLSAATPTCSLRSAPATTRRMPSYGPATKPQRAEWPRRSPSPATWMTWSARSYYRVLRVVKAGSGPQDAFRPYLFSTMRRFAIDTARSYQRRVTLTDQAADLEAEPAPSAADVAAVNAEQRAAWRAWASLPEASRAVLWHAVVEGQTPAEIAPILGTSPNGVTLRARRAKERLRQAFLQQHLAATDNQECRETRRLLGPYIRDALSSRDRAAVDEHLAGCERCRAVLLEIDDVNNTLRAAIAPVILGGALAAGHYLSSAGSAGHAAAFGVSPIGSGGAPGGAGAKSGDVARRQPAILAEQIQERDAGCRRRRRGDRCVARHTRRHPRRAEPIAARGTEPLHGTVLPGRAWAHHDRIRRIVGRFQHARRHRRVRSRIARGTACRRRTASRVEHSGRPPDCPKEPLRRAAARAQRQPDPPRMLPRQRRSNLRRRARRRPPRRRRSRARHL